MLKTSCISKSYGDDFEIAKFSSFQAAEVDYEYNSLNTTPHPPPPPPDRESISCLVYRNIDNQPIVVQLPYMTEPIDKKEVLINDGSIKLTLWVRRYQMYRQMVRILVEKALVRKYMSSVCLTSNTCTTVKPSEEKMNPVESFIRDSHEVKFPPSNIKGMWKTYSCSKCHKYMECKSESNIFKCPICGVMCLKSSTASQYVVKLLFDELCGNIITIMFGP